jgi:hypothetical protein
MNILTHATQILYERAEEKSREYGNFDESIETTRRIASAMSNREYELADVYNILIALKLSRESHGALKYDSYLDAIVYLAQKHDHLSRTRTAADPPQEPKSKWLQKDY